MLVRRRRWRASTGTASGHCLMVTEYAQFTCFLRIRYSGRFGQGIRTRRMAFEPPPYHIDQTWLGFTLVPRATLRGVAELHVASGMPQWRMFVTCCYF